MRPLASLWTFGDHPGRHTEVRIKHDFTSVPESSWLWKKLHQKVRSLLSELRVNLLDISVDESDFSSIQGTSGIKYYSSNWASRPSQNMLKCAEFKGKALSIDEIADEKFTLKQTYTTSDKFIIKESRLSCTLSRIEMSGIACIRQLFMLAAKGGWEVSFSADEFYKRTLEKNHSPSHNHKNHS